MSARVVVLISGTGTNLKALLDAASVYDYQVVGVASNRTAAGLAYATDAGIDATTVKPRRDETRESYDARLADVIDVLAPDLIVLAGFMRILSTGFVTRYTGKLINIHPSLLPRYRGLDVHERVLASNDTTSGASVHFVTPELDSGPVLVQGVVPVLPDDTVASLSARVHAAEHKIYPLAVALILNGRGRLQEQHLVFDQAPLETPLRAHFNLAGDLTTWPVTDPPPA